MSAVTGPLSESQIAYMSRETLQVLDVVFVQILHIQLAFGLMKLLIQNADINFLPYLGTKKYSLKS